MKHLKHINEQFEQDYIKRFWTSGQSFAVSDAHKLVDIFRDIDVIHIKIGGNEHDIVSKIQDALAAKENIVIDDTDNKLADYNMVCQLLKQSLDNKVCIVFISAGNLPSAIRNRVLVV